MAKETKLFDRYKKKLVRETKLEDFINPELLAKQIEKAVNFIKVKQFHSGFPEIFSPEQGGNIEVTIKRDSKNFNIFHISFIFMTLPDRLILFREQKIITYAELKRLANEYDKHKDQIDEELCYRDRVVKSQWLI